MFLNLERFMLLFAAKARIHRGSHELVLEYEKDYDDGYDADGGSRQEHRPIGLPVLEVFQADRQCHLVIIIDDDHRP